ncbi:putative leucine-rich repeat receptor-like protein kinase [Dorcoceras hygrometricum]|uniref:Putative leucine-rich repeat receptor-like protein kinase n=1 Tax=Dorcoceras hygrometricum TaxID=472368 RepID=A0A2Z7AM44_9LAMI|nr:putative leucine-rich repeat receptor-like protein kinase [Dorcoceras hygrometricum]
MPPRRGRGRTTRRTEEESRAGSNDYVHQVEDVTRQIGGMELVLARFQRTNPPTFSAAEGGAMAEAWLAQMEELFDTLEYAKRLKLFDTLECWRQWRIRIPFPGDAAEAPGSDQFHKETGTSKGITDSACKNQLVVVSVQYGPFYTYIPIRSTTIGKSRVAIDPITMHTSWRSNSDITSVTRQIHLPKTHPVLWSEIYHTIVSSNNIGYPRMRASGESSTMKHRLLHASGPHPIPPPNDPK